MKGSRINDEEAVEEIAKDFAIADGWNESLWPDGMSESYKRRCYTRAWAVLEALKGAGNE